MGMRPSEGKYFGEDIIHIYESDKDNTKFSYWTSPCLLFIDSLLGFVMSSLFSVISLKTETHLVFMTLITNSLDLKLHCLQRQG